MIKFDQVWENILIEIQARISAFAYDSYFTNMKAVCLHEDVLVISCENEAKKAVIEKRYGNVVTESAKKILPNMESVLFILPEEIDKYKKYSEEVIQEVNSENIVIEEDNIFSPKCTFQNFIVGKSNEFAAAASKAVAQEPGIKYNPLFIYGGVGLGKTHLLNAIGNHIKNTKPKLKCMYISCERFTNELIGALRGSNYNDSMNEFRKKYRSVDVLMIDDIQFISKTVSTQEELFHTFNDLYNKDKQIIICSDRPPQEIVPLEERLRTRFQGGVVADITAPDFETRIAILQSEAYSQNQNVSNDTLKLIANRVPTNIREMKGVLTKIICYAQLTDKNINDKEVLDSALKEYNDDKKEAVTIDRIVECVCNYFPNVTKKDIIGKKKNKEIVEPRQMCVYLVTELMTVPLLTIGQYFGGRDHTTIMYTRDKMANLVTSDSHIATQVKDIKNMIAGK